MPQLRTGFVTSALALVAVAWATAASTRTIVLDLDSWNQVIASGFANGAVVERRLRIENIVYYDTAGDGVAYHDPSETAWVSLMTGGERNELRPRSDVFGLRPPIFLEDGDLHGRFGCHPAVWPCLGLTRAQIFFPKPIWGLAGFLEYDYGDVRFNGHPVGDQLMVDPFRSGWRQASEALGWIDTRMSWQTFFGVIYFNEPVDSLLFDWRPEGWDGTTAFVLRSARMLVSDDGSGGGADRFDGPIGVSEPSPLALLALALFGLVVSSLPVRLRLRPPSFT